MGRTVKKNQEQIGTLRVWWIPQIPGAPFYVVVASLAEARLILKTLAEYDLFQLKHNIKPDYSNTGGLEIKTESAWEEFETADGDSIDDLSEEQVLELDQACIERV